MAAVQDFNYKVALASGLRELQAGRLRQAEQQFSYLCAKFPDAVGGYRGLAKVRMEQADRPGALTVLRDGAAKLARAGQHDGVVALLTEALQLDPLDLAAHRRLAAAHALAGELDAAAAEYARFAHALRQTDPSGAQRDVRYGLDAFGAVPGLLTLAAELGIDTSAVAPPTRPATPPRVEAPPVPAGAIPGVPRRGRRDKGTSADREPAADAAVDPRLGAQDALDLSARSGAADPVAPEPAPPQPWAPSAPLPSRERVPEPELDASEDPI
ncbi:MAG TPA: hypothetical protein VGT60_04065, partial [Candidatus Limnocylindria bacterium]|nr:hypothetical protein [Candidatus Limnocylindria bacterium]